MECLVVILSVNPRQWSHYCLRWLSVFLYLGCLHPQVELNFCSVSLRQNSFPSPIVCVGTPRAQKLIQERRGELTSGVASGFHRHQRRRDCV